jgi:hypothetical protein
MAIESLKKEFLAIIEANKECPLYPAVLDSSFLEDAFKVPVCDEQGYSESLPAITSHYRHGETPDGIKILSSRSAIIASSLYTRYLDEEALVWDQAKGELYLYVPDSQCPRIAFKSMSWTCARRLTSEFRHIDLRDIYQAIKPLIHKSI